MCQFYIFSDAHDLPVGFRLRLFSMDVSLKTAQPICVNLVILTAFVGISIDAAPTGLDPLLQLFSTKIPSLRDSRNQKPI